MKKYKVNKSEFYSEENETLFSSYIFEYYSTRVNKWCILKNGDMKTYLKDTVTRGYLLTNEVVECDFDMVLGIGRRIK